MADKQFSKSVEEKLGDDMPETLRITPKQFMEALVLLQEAGWVIEDQSTSRVTFEATGISRKLLPKFLLWRGERAIEIRPMAEIALYVLWRFSFEGCQGIFEPYIFLVTAEKIPAELRDMEEELLAVLGISSRNVEFSERLVEVVPPSLFLPSAVRTIIVAFESELRETIAALLSALGLFGYA